MPRARSFALVVLLAAIGCGGSPPAPGPAPLPAATLDLIPRFAEAEVRSDALDLDVIVRQPGIRGRGWVIEPAAERRPRTLWSRRLDAELRLPFATTGAKDLVFSAHAHASLGPELPLEVRLNGRTIGRVDLAAQDREVRMVLPAEAQVEGEDVLALVVPRQHAPDPAEPGDLPLAVAITSLSISPSGGRVTPPAVQSGALWLPARAEAAFYLRRPHAETALRLAGPAGVTATLDEGSGSRALGRTAGGEVRLPMNGAADAFVRVRLRNEGEAGAQITTVRLEHPPIAATPPPVREAARAPSRPNVLVFLVDTLRADVLGAYGHARPTSPRFDAFAKEALVFRDAWAQASWTRPAVASIFTGLDATTHGVGGVDRRLPEELTTMAELFQQSGYSTGAFVANHLVSEKFGFAQGFGTWNDADDRHVYGLEAPPLAARALRWIDRQKGPFFLYVHTLDSHSPYAPKPQFWAPFRPPGTTPAQVARLLLDAHQGKVPESELGPLVSAYEGEVRQDDEGFGALLEGLRSRGLLDRSVVVFTADHGEEFLEHGGMEHAHTLYQELLHIPLAVRLPGASGAGTRAQRVQQVDLLPTLLGLSGLPRPKETPGRDLSAEWTKPETARDADDLFFSEARFGAVHKLAVRAGRWKLILNDDRRALWRAGVPVELYDLEADAKEKDNAVAREPIVAGYLLRRVNALLDLQDDLRQRAAGQTVPLSPEDREQLKALGYVQ